MKMEEADKSLKSLIKIIHRQYSGSTDKKKPALAYCIQSDRDREKAGDTDMPAGRHTGSQRAIRTHRH